MSVTIVLRVRAMPSDWGAKLYLVGNLPELSEWGTYAPLPLKYMDGFFTAALAVPAHAHIEYKYVLAEHGKVVRWEAPSTINRTLDTGVNGSTIVVDDGIFDTDQHTEVRTFDREPSIEEDDDPYTYPARRLTQHDELLPPTSAESSTVDTHLDEDDDVLSDDSSLKTRPSAVHKRALPAASPPPAPDSPAPDSNCARDLALAADLDACRDHLVAIRGSLRRLRALAPGAACATGAPDDDDDDDARAAGELAACLGGGPALLALLGDELSQQRRRRAGARAAAAAEAGHRPAVLLLAAVAGALLVWAAAGGCGRAGAGFRDRLRFERGRREWGADELVWGVAPGRVDALLAADDAARQRRLAGQQQQQQQRQRQAGRRGAGDGDEATGPGRGAGGTRWEGVRRGVRAMLC